jgi:hypothetical protein
MLAGGTAVFALAVLAACSVPPPTSIETVQSRATQVAPTVQAASTAAGPTVGAVQTRVSGTVQAEATAAAPAAAVAATQAAPTLQAVRTVVAAPVLSMAVRTATAISPLRIASVGTNEADPTITVRNDGDSPISLNGWTFLVGNGSVTIPTTSTWTVAAKSAVTLHLSRGTTRGDQIYLGPAAGTVATDIARGRQVALLDSRKQPVSIYDLATPTSATRR